MANTGRTQIQKIARWQLLENRLGERLAEVPALAEDHAELQRIIAEALALEAKSELHRAGAQEVTVKRGEIAKTGETLRSQIVLALQYRFGPRNKQLMEFGVRPRAGGTRKKTETPPPASAEVQAVEAPVAQSPSEAS